MRKLLALPGLFLALAAGGAPAYASPAKRAAILTPSTCAGVALSLDFAINSGSGRYCLNGTRYSGPTFVPGWSFSRASTGYALNSAGSLVSFGSGVPRITDLGLLIEMAATNNWLQSQAFDNATRWTATAGSVTADQVVAPDGTTTADAFAENTANAQHILAQGFNFVASSTNTLSVFVKPGSRTQVNLFFSSVYNTGNAGATFNLTGTGSVASTTGGATTSIILLANGFYRVSVTATANTVNTTANGFIAPCLGGANSYQGNGSTSLYLWGAQAEAGSIATPYIPTTSASATGAADNSAQAVTVTAGQGFTMFAQAKMGAITGVIQTVAYLNDGSDNNRVIVRRNADDSVSLFVSVAGVTTEVANVASKGGARTLKVAISRTGPTYALAVDGVLVNSGSVSSMPTLTAVQLGASRALVDFLNAPLQRWVLYPSAYSNAQLQALTQ